MTRALALTDVKLARARTRSRVRSRTRQGEDQVRAVVREAPGLLRARARPRAKGREGEVRSRGSQGEGECAHWGEVRWEGGYGWMTC